MKSGFWYLRAVCPIPPFPYPPQIKCLQSIFWWKCPTCLGWICIQGGSLATKPPASDIHHSFFQLFPSSFSSSFCLKFRLCRRNLHISAFCKGSGSRKWSKCWCGPRPRPGKGGEPWCCWGGEMFQGREKEASWDCRCGKGNMCDLMRGICQ